MSRCLKQPQVNPGDGTQGKVHAHVVPQVSPSVAYRKTQHSRFLVYWFWQMKALTLTAAADDKEPALSNRADEKLASSELLERIDELAGHMGGMDMA